MSSRSAREAMRPGSPCCVGTTAYESESENANKERGRVMRGTSEEERGSIEESEGGKGGEGGEGGCHALRNAP